MSVEISVSVDRDQVVVDCVSVDRDQRCARLSSDGSRSDHTHIYPLTAPQYRDAAPPNPARTKARCTAMMKTPQNRDSARRCAADRSRLPPADLVQPPPPGHDSSARQIGATAYLLTYLKAGSKRDKLCVMLESPLLSPPFPALWEIRSQPSAVGPVAKVSADRRSTPRPIAPPDANLSPALLQAALPNALLSRLCVLSAQPMPGLCASRSFAHNEARHPASLHGSTPARPHPASAPVPVTAALTASLI